MVSRRWKILVVCPFILSLPSNLKAANFPQAVAAGKILNNFVTELLNVQTTVPKPYKEYKFLHKRDGWVFISASVDPKGSDKIWISLDSTPKGKAVIVYEKEKDITLEAMRLLSASEHKINVWSEGRSSLKNLIVRSIPEILHFSYDSGPPEFGPYDWNFLQKNGVLDNVNVRIGKVNEYDKPYIKQWKKQGKKWMVCTWPPGKAEDAYEYWADKIRDPLCDGIIVDEFEPTPKLLIYAEAIRKLHRNFPDKGFYPWMAHALGKIDESYNPKWCDETYIPFISAVIDVGSKFVPERYFEDFCLTEAEARKDIEYKLKEDMLRWRKAIPGCEKNMIICPTNFVLPDDGCSRNVNPYADYKVVMDLEFNFLANDPAFEGMYGIMAWASDGTDPETMRWLSKIYRHYCIEGKTSMLSRDYGYSYVLDYIQNCDFEENQKGWTFFPAEEASMAVKQMKGLGWWQGRKPAPSRRSLRGNTFLWMRRSSKRPNTFSQEIKNLKLGRLYSLKMITGDFQNLTYEALQKHAVSINLQNVDLIPDKSIQYVYRGNQRRYFNYHYRVFRATAGQAILTVSDWLNDNDPGGPVGQEIICNFIELQPYLDENE